MAVSYFKKYQRSDLWNYYKLLSDRNPPACERLIFLNERPAVDFSEYNLSDPGSRIDYNSIRENGEPIEASEYEAAYQRATSVEFNLYINGKLSGA